MVAIYINLLMRFVSSFVNCAVNQSQYDIVQKERSTMKQFTPREIAKRHAVLRKHSRRMLQY